MPERPRRRNGFRFSATDALVLGAGAALTWWLWRDVGSMALVVPVTLFHFFLFCNVFRVRRGAELIWAGVFLVNFTGRILRDPFSWWGLLAVQLPVTLTVIVLEIRHPRYHGIFSRPGATSDGAVAEESAPAPLPAPPQP